MTLYLNEPAPWELKKQAHDTAEIKNQMQAQTSLMKDQLSALSRNYAISEGPDHSYVNYLQQNQYSGDIERGIEEIGYQFEDGMSKIGDGLDRLADINKQGFLGVATAQAVTSAISTKLIVDSIQTMSSDICESIEDVGNTLSWDLDQVKEGIAGLHADFNIACGKVLAQFELSRVEVNAGFMDILDIMMNQRKFQAKENFFDGMGYYKDGCRFPHNAQWFSDALKHLLLTVDLYSRNPLAQLHIGHIYHYQEEHRDFAKAIEHYTKCYVYGEANKKHHKIAAQGCFYAGWLYAVINKDYIEAVEFMKKAIELDPRLGEAYFNMAKFYSLMDNPAEAVKNLRFAIENYDRKYCLKAALDKDFDNIAKARQELLDDLRAKAEQKFDEKTQSILAELAKFPSLEKEVNEVNEAVLSAKSRDTYFDYLDASSYLEKLETELSKRIKAEKKRIKARIKLDAIERLIKADLSEFPCLEKETGQVNEIVLSARTKDDYISYLEAVSSLEKLRPEIAKSIVSEKLRIKTKQEFYDEVKSIKALLAGHAYLKKEADEVDSILRSMQTKDNYSDYAMALSQLRKLRPIIIKGFAMEEKRIEAEAIKERMRIDTRDEFEDEVRRWHPCMGTEANEVYEIVERARRLDCYTGYAEAITQLRQYRLKVAKVIMQEKQRVEAKDKFDTEVQIAKKDLSWHSKFLKELQAITDISEAENTSPGYQEALDDLLALRTRLFRDIEVRELWSVKTKRWVNKVAVSADNKYAAVLIVTRFLKRVILKIIDLKSGKVVRALRGYPHKKTGTADYYLSISRDSKNIMFGLQDHNLWIVNIETKKNFKADWSSLRIKCNDIEGCEAKIIQGNDILEFDCLEKGCSQRMAGDVCETNDKVFSPDVKLIAKADKHQCVIFDARTGERIQVVEGFKQIKKIQFSKSGKYIFVIDRRHISKFKIVKEGK